jgi:hypothetical protein
MNIHRWGASVGAAFIVVFFMLQEEKTDYSILHGF